MSDLSDVFIKLLDRQPSDEEIQNLYRIRDALELKNNDALWLVLIALEHYQSLYKKVPESIAKSATDILTKFKHTANVLARHSLASAHADLAQAVAQTAKNIADSSSRTLQLKWISLVISVALLSLGTTALAMFYVGSNSGFNEGYKSGYEQIKLENARNEWANTYDGQLAYKFGQVGDIQRFANCNGKGWKLNNGLCTPQAEGGVVQGWFIPK